MNILKEKWYPVGPPWGDGSWAVAGNMDPHAGVYVFDCQTGEDEVEQDPAKLVAYICDLHNKSF